MKKRIVDLHLHSIYSDGSKSPEELVDLAIANNISTIALTDHDDIEGSKEIVKINKGVTIYSGVELTVKAPKGRMHILGYNIDLENEALNSRLREIKEATIYNMLLYIEILKKDFSIVLPQNEVDSLINSKGNIGRPHLALLLIKLGYCKDVDEAFDNYLVHAYEKVRKVKKGLSKEEAISLITEAGGVASLAHPCSLKMDNEELRSEIKLLKEMGLECIEITHIHTTPEQREFYRTLRDEFSLLESGGTDFHGYEVKPDVQIGTGRNGNVYIEEGALSLTKKIKSRYM